MTSGAGGGVEVARFYATLGMDSSGLTTGAAAARQSFGGMLAAGVGLGSGLAVVTTAINLVSGAIRASLGAAISYESAMAQVRKVVELSDTDFNTLSQSIRAMALELPVSRDELAAIAKVAGQLGVEGVANIAKFTEVTAKVAAVTEIPAEEIATSLGRLSTVMQRDIADVDKLASGIFALASASAANEREILEFSLRIAGAAQVVGISDGMVLALSSTLASLGINAEAGGTAMLQAMLKINEVVIEGGDKLKLLAAVSGVTSQEFARQWGEDADAAWLKFVGGMGRSGKAAGAILDALGLDGARSANAFLALGQSSDYLTGQLTTGNAALQDAATLNSAYGIIASTTAAQIQLFNNSVTELAGAVGTHLTSALVLVLPMLTQFVGLLAKAAQGGGGAAGGATRGAASGILGAVPVVGPIINAAMGANTIDKWVRDNAPAWLAGTAAVRERTARDEADMAAELGAPRGTPGYLPSVAVGAPAGAAAGGGMTPEQELLRALALGITGGAGAANPLADARKQIESTLQADLIKAYTEGGDARVAIVQAEQAALMAEVEATAARMSQVLGIDLAKTLGPSFESIRDRAADATRAAGQSFGNLLSFMIARHTAQEGRAPLVGGRGVAGAGATSTDQRVSIAGGVTVIIPPGTSVQDARAIFEESLRKPGLESQ